jgi:predicted MPP superfamily phosphohydrolase
MTLTLLFYLAFALGELAILVWTINVVHGLGWKSRRLEGLTLVALVVVLAGSLELARRWWMVPAGQWPLALRLLAATCCLVTLVGIPLATVRRWRRRAFAEIGRKDERIDLAGDGPRERFVGRGRHSWLLRLPGNEALDLVVHHWAVPFPNLPAELDGLSILHLTDLHFAHAYDRRYFEAVFERAAGYQADLVLTTGDLIDDPDCVSWIRPLFEKLPALLGRFVILGNHDHYHETEAIASAVRESGHTMLDGTVECLEFMGRRLAVGGTCAPWGPAIDDAAIPEADFRILLSHTPDIAYQAASQRWDFMVCGHNHAGQVQLPLVGPLLMPSRFSRRFEREFYRIEPTLMYVSRGLGAKHPIRFGAPPEISLFTLSRPGREGPPASGPGNPVRRAARLVPRASNER